LEKEEISSVATATNIDLLNDNSKETINGEAASAEKETAPETLPTAHSDDAYDAATYGRQLHEALVPLPEAQGKTAFYTKRFMAGLCNQYGRFIGIMLLARKNGFDQIIEESINWRDTFGTNTDVHTSKMWDVVHWNSFYPVLPRFVRYEKDIHEDLTIIEGENYAESVVKYNVSEGFDIWNSSMPPRPPPFGLFPNQGENHYRTLMRKIDHDRAQWDDKSSLKIYETILKGALRPHPFLQTVIDQTASKLGGLHGQGYMVIHMRVEPDMARQMNCGDKKVWYVDNITDMIYKEYPEPPVQTVLIVFARALIEDLEEQAKTSRREINHHQKVNRHNLNKIKDLLDNGMWGGKVKVVEAGSVIVEEAGNPFYKYYSNIAGGIVNFFLAVQSKILVGTEISTWSTLSMNTRYYRDIKENYFYRPEGLKNVTNVHWFRC